MQPIADHPRYLDARRHARSVRGFYTHALIYCFVIGGLLALSLLDNTSRFWPGWPAFGWGIGLAAHALSVFAVPGFFGAAWEERKIREYLERRP